MKIAQNPETGEYLGLQDGQWHPLKIAANDAGEKMFLGPDGWQTLDTPGALTPNTPAQEGGALRSLGLGARNVLEGVGGVVGSVVNPVANLASWIASGNPNYFKNPGEAAADVAGFATPQNSGERIRGDIISGASAALPFLGAGMALQAAGRAPQAAAALSDVPALQAASGGAAGGAMGGARESGAGVPGQLAAGLAAGVTPFGAAALARAGVNELRSVAGAFDRLTPGGQERLAGTALDRMASDPARVRQLLATSGDGVLVPGSMPTTAQLAGDPGLAVVEKGLASSTGGSAIGARYTSQQDARREALNILLNPVAERQAAAIESVGPRLADASPFGGNLDQSMAGGMIRSAFDDAYGGMRNQVRQAYGAIDPEGTASFDLRPLQASFQDVVGTGRYQRVPQEISGIMKQIADDIEGGVNVSYRDLQDMRSLVSDLSFQAGKSGDAATKRLATGMRGAIDNYLERSSMAPELMGGAPTAQPGGAGYRAASASARDAMSADPWYDDLTVMMKNGLNREATERMIGPAGVEELNRMAPGLVRNNGRMLPDTAAAELGSFESLIQQTGGGSYHADADDFLQALEGRLSGMYGRKRQAFQNLREQALQEPNAPHTGFTSEQADAYRQAMELRRLQGSQFEQGANRPLTLRGDLLGGERVADSAIPGGYFKPGGAGTEGMEAFSRSVGGDETARSAMMYYVVQDALKSSTKNGVVDHIRLSKWISDHESAMSMFDAAELRTALYGALESQQGNFAARQALGKVASVDKAGNWQLAKAQRQFPSLPPEAGLTQDEAASFLKSQWDLKRALDTDNMAAVKGSPTAQLTNTMKDLTGYELGTMKGGGYARNLVNRLASKFTADADTNINNMMIEAVLDPNYALKLMQNTNNMPGMRQWAARGGQESYADMLRRYGVATSLGAARNASQAQPQ